MQVTNMGIVPIATIHPIWHKHSMRLNSSSEEPHYGCLQKELAEWWWNFLYGTSSLERLLFYTLRTNVFFPEALYQLFWIVHWPHCGQFLPFLTFITKYWCGLSWVTGTFFLQSHFHIELCIWFFYTLSSTSIEIPLNAIVLLYWP